MSATGRPEREYRSAQHEGNPVSAVGRAELDYRNAQDDGAPVSLDVLGGVLPVIARAAIAARLGLAAPVAAGDSRLAEPGATFVTLKQDGALRGCIGSLEATRALGIDVRENALAAAFRDPRFAPLVAAEFAATSIEVSLLSANERITFDSEAHLLAQLRPGTDGVVLECDGRRATFLPQVWEIVPEPRQFLAELKRKAGLPTDFWSPRLVIRRYGVIKFTEADAVAAGVAR